MKERTAPNFRRLAIFAAALIVVSIALIFWARDIIREVIVLPLSYIFWVLGIILRVTPQIFFWIVLLLIILQIAWRALVVRKKTADTGARVLVDETPPLVASGRAAYWVRKVELLNMSRSAYYSSTFHNALSHLLMDTLSYRYREPPRVIEDQLRNGGLDVPPQVRDYVLSHGYSQEAVYHGFFHELIQSLVDRLRDLWERITGRQDAGAAPVDPQVAFILNYLEEELEVSHDDSGR